LKVQCDSTVLTAMRAPRPTLLIYGAEDEWGIRAPMHKIHLYDGHYRDDFIAIMGKGSSLAKDDILRGRSTWSLCLSDCGRNGRRHHRQYRRLFAWFWFIRKCTKGGSVASNVEICVRMRSIHLACSSLCQKKLHFHHLGLRGCSGTHECRGHNKLFQRSITGRESTAPLNG
jgi:hypothetical protein